MKLAHGTIDTPTSKFISEYELDCVIATVAGGPWGCGCWDADANADGSVDQNDVTDRINTIAGGGCP